MWMRKFQSTLPVGGATNHTTKMEENKNISIHAPRGGSDFFPDFLMASSSNFNPRSPWGERQQRCTNFRQHLWQRHQICQAQSRKSCAKQAQKEVASSQIPEKKSCEPPGILCTLTLRATKSGYPPADRCSCSRNAQLSFRIDSPNSRNGGCPFPDP